MELNTESIIIKNLIVNGEFFGKTMPILKKKYFLDVGAQNIFELLKNHYSNYKVIPSITDLVASVQNIQTDETRTNVIESLKFINAIPESTNIEHMLDETVSFVKDAMYTEALLLGSDGLVQKNSDKKIQAQAIMEEMSKLSIDTDLGLDFEDIEVMIKYYQEKLLGIKTQHEEFNKRLGAGFLPGTLSIIMAPSGGGKSLLMTDFISGMMKEGKNILLVSMEMLDKELMKRIHANALDLPINDLRELPENVIRNAYDNVKDTCGKFFIKDYPPGSFSPLMLEQLIESYKVEKNIEFDIIYLDYLGIMKSDLVSPSAGLYSYVKSIVEETRAIAVKHKLPIISASQLNRSSVGNIDANNDSVSDSLGTVMTADFIVFLLQTEQMKEENLISCKVTKNRFNGRTDQWNMEIDYNKMRFSDTLVDTTLSKETEVELDNIIEEQRKNDMKIVKEHDMKDDFDIMSELGL